MAAALAVAAALVAAPGAFAAGETTHAFMAEEAIDALPDGPLRSLLSAHRLEVMSGAGYPDTGYWVENGVIQYPVEEITIAGNMREMFQQIVGIGNDVLDRGNKQTGSILIEKMVIAGS